MQQQVSTIQPRYLSMKDAATYTGLTTRTLHKAVANNSVRSFLNGRKRLILRESLDAWIEGKPASARPARLHQDDIKAIATAVVKLLRGEP